VTLGDFWLSYLGPLVLLLPKLLIILAFQSLSIWSVPDDGYFRKV
jgi:hypothetical protein